MQTRFTSILPILLAIVLACSSPVAAAHGDDPPPAGLEDEMSLFEDIPSVFSASKYEQKVTEAPSSVSIVTAAEIKKYGYRTLADLLRSVRSFHLSYDRANELVGVRGFNRPGDSNSRFLLLINGHRTNDNIFNAANVGTAALLDVDLIERVEVVRGPSSSLYGTNAFFAVINIITKRGRDLQGVEVAGDAGTHETYRGRLSYGNRLPTGLEVLLSGSRYESDGNDRLYFQTYDQGYVDHDDRATNNGIAEDGDTDEFYSLFGRLSFLDFTLEGAYVDREKRLPTASYGTKFNDPDNQGESSQGYGQLTYEHHFANQMDVLARGSYNLYYQDADFVYDIGPPDTIVNKDRFRGEWWGGELQITKRLWEDHKLVLGGEYHNNFRQDQENFYEEPFFQVMDENRDSENWGLFAQDEFQALENVILSLGVRHDHYDTFGGSTNPRLALIYTPFEKTTLKALYGEAFKAPNAFELYYHDGPAYQKPSPDLDPEKIKTYELVWEQYLGNNLRAVVEGFYYEIDDLINLMEDATELNPDGGPIVVFGNIDQVEAKGVEVELEGKWDSLTGRVSYTFQQTEDSKTEQLLSNSPKHLAKLNLTVPLLRNKVLLGIEEQYTSARKTISLDKTGGYAVTNLTLFGQKLLQGLEVSASVYNLFDKSFSDPASGANYPLDVLKQDGRAFRFKLTYTF